MPAWTPFVLRTSEKSPNGQRALVFDNYLVIKLDYDPKEENNQCPQVLVVDMIDNSVQDMQINDESWIFDSWRSQNSWTKYKDNQIIKFGKVKGGKMVMNLITIESFQRIFFVNINLVIFFSFSNEM